jgi:hypothetical protein
MSARVQQVPFRVLVGANTPAVLIEMGYITNPEQEQQLTWRIQAGRRPGAVRQRRANRDHPINAPRRLSGGAHTRR